MAAPSTEVTYDIHPHPDTGPGPERGDHCLPWAGAQIAQDILFGRFRAGTTARSEPYKQGFRRALDAKANRAAIPPCPYQAGTTEFDAYFSGIEHACEAWRIACR